MVHYIDMERAYEIIKRLDSTNNGGITIQRTAGAGIGYAKDGSFWPRVVLGAVSKGHHTNGDTDQGALEIMHRPRSCQLIS